MSALMNTYGTRAITLVKGEGPYVWDDQGRRYLDAISGIAVCGLGYNHPGMIKALCDQANTLVHCSNLYMIEPQQKLGKALVEISGMEEVFFSNSGAEANEAAIKIARKFGQAQGIASPQIITADKSFHGRTMATLSATGNEKVKTGFYPLLDGFVHAAYNDIQSIIDASTEHTVAVMVEPVQGEGGINVPSEHFLNDLRALCDEKGWLMILDEIQSGNGRTGTYFAYHHTDIKPDVLTTAKGLGNGVPIGACLARGPAAGVLQAGNHGSTFGGNPLATNTALAVVEAINTPQMLERVSSLGQWFIDTFQKEFEGNAEVVDIRGKGLMIGIQLAHDCAPLVDAARELGVLINVTAGNTIRLLPPFILSDEQAQDLVHCIVTLVTDLEPSPKQNSTFKSGIKARLKPLLAKFLTKNTSK